MLKLSPTLAVLACFFGSLAGTPARSEPCLSSETITYIRQKLGEIPGTIFLGSIGLGTCTHTSSQEEAVLKRQIAELEAQAPLSEPEIQQCPTTTGGSSEQHFSFSTPGHLARPTVSCSCNSYKAENEKLRVILAKANVMLSKTR